MVGEASGCAEFAHQLQTLRTLNQILEAEITQTLDK